MNSNENKEICKFNNNEKIINLKKDIEECMSKDTLKKITNTNLNNLKDSIEKQSIYFEKNEINTYRENLKPFISTNNNVLFIDKTNLIIFGENKTNLELEYKKSLFNLLKEKFDKNPNEIFIYRNGKILKGIKNNNKYIDENGKNIIIFLGDIISTNIENINKSIIDVDELQKQTGFIKVNNIRRYKNNLILNIDTYFSEQKGLEIIYNPNNKKIIKGLNLLSTDISFYINFKNTFNFFKGINIFDEPINEKPGEQLDGNLRPLALKALKEGKKYYIYNGIKYDLYKEGKPNIPQVCIDYVLDFYEKLNNSYLVAKKDKKIDFEEILGGFFEKRRITNFIESINNNKNNINDLFTLEEIKTKLGTSYKEGQITEKFIKEELSKKVSIGDLLIISGIIKPSNKIYNHIVLVSNINQNGNIYIRENPLFPKETSLLEVISRAPYRKIKYIVNVNKKLKNYNVN